MTQFYRVEQVAAILGVTPRTVHNLIARGRFPGAHKIDPACKSVWRIPVGEVQQYQNQQHQVPNGQGN